MYVGASPPSTSASSSSVAVSVPSLMTVSTPSQAFEPDTPLTPVSTLALSLKSVPSSTPVVTLAQSLESVSP